MQDASPTRVKETFDNWSLYDAVIQNNYMQHRELTAALRSTARQIPGVLRIVDLGCGDAFLASRAFADDLPDQYQGVDLSEAAVDRARQHLADWDAVASVQCGNILEFITSVSDSSANLILASYSLHHFGEVHKEEIVSHCFRALRSGGIFCWIDPVRDENESRDEYIRRLTDSMLQDWTGLDVAQRQRATQHVWDCDFPETTSWMQNCCRRAGFEESQRLFQNEVFGGWAFVKS